MALKSHTKSWIVAFLDNISSLGLKLGIPVATVAVAYLLWVIFGPRFAHMDKLSAADSDYLINSAVMACKGLTIASIAIVASVMIRLFYDEIVGQTLSVLGLLLYFGTPEALARFVHVQNARAASLALAIVNEFCIVGAICVLPGLVLVVRDGILRIWRGISVRRVLESRWGDEREREKKKKPKIYGNCWDMAYCRDFVRRVCPAFKKKRPCWRIKVGCYCDEHTILMAMASQGDGNESYEGILHSLGIDGQSKQPKVSAKVKRIRCRRCGIYAEHQRQKYRLLSPMVFPAMIFAVYLLYGHIARYVSVALEKTDQFIGFLSYKSVASASYASDSHVLTNIAVVWLTIILISYTLRTLEYLIFDLQV
ncbi:hypothetical protein LLG46_07035 [bacterium]|nr:hypothetical protein [bacterium]